MSDWNPSSDGRRTILHVVNTLCDAGTERMLVSLLARFDHDRMRHVVVTLRDAGAGAAALPDDVACHALDRKGRSRLEFLRLARLVRRWGAEVVHARNTGCWWDATLASLITPRARAVLGFHGMDRLDVACNRFGRVARWSARRGALFTSVSHHGAGLLHDQLGVPAECISVLRNGVDTSRFQPCSSDARNTVRRTMGLPADAIVVGSIGSLTSIKRFDLLIDAFGEVRTGLNNLYLLLVGDGPLRESLTQRANELGVADCVRFLGAQKDVAKMLALMDVFVCSSDFEGMSNAMLEAMACGLPVISTDVGDHPSIIEKGGAGLIVSRNNVRELAWALTQLIDNRDRQRITGQAARGRALDFTIEQTAAEYERFYTSLLAPVTVPEYQTVWSDTAKPGVSPQAV